MKKAIIILFVFVNIITFGQHNLGSKLNGGVSKVNNTIKISNGTIYNQFAPSGQIGLFYNFDFTKKSSFNIELLFNQIEGKERTEFDLTDEYGGVIGNVKIDFNKHLSYISLPIFYGYKLKRFKIELGIQLSLLLTSSGNGQTKMLYNGDNSTSENKYDDLLIDNYDYGSILGLSYDITDKIIVVGNFY